MTILEYYNKVRLTPKNIDAIVDAFSEFFPTTDHLWIFGSRVDLDNRGGDIDLYIETLLDKPAEVIDRKFKMVSKIWQSIGEQKIDVVLNILELDSKLPIHDIARKNGVQLR